MIFKLRINIQNIYKLLILHDLKKVSTLRFSSRMMNVTVEPAVNEIIDPMVNFITKNSLCWFKMLISYNF